jgi:hypothetical protein
MTAQGWMSACCSIDVQEQQLRNAVRVVQQSKRHTSATIVLTQPLLLCLQDIKQMPSCNKIGLLQLAMNCNSHATAATVAARHLLALLEPAAARKLLLTAVQRRHADAVQCMLAKSAVAEHVDAANVTAAINQLLAAHRDHTSSGQLASVLVALPAAQQLDGPAVMHLMRTAAAEHDNCVCVRHLCTLPAAQQLGSEEVLQLLQVVVAAAPGVRSCFDWSTDHLSTLPAAQQISSVDVAVLLVTAMQRVNFDSATYLCKLPGAQQLSSDQVARVLKAAVQHSKVGIATASLCKLPAAQLLSSSIVLDMMVVAGKRNDFFSTHALCQLPAAEQLPRHSVRQLMHITMDTDDGNCINELCSLPAAEQLRRRDIIKLLDNAVMCDSAHCLGCLIGLPAAQNLEREAIEGLLNDAAAYGCSRECMRHLQWLQG